MKIILLKCSQFLSPVSWLKMTDFSGTISAHHQILILIMDTEMVPETSVVFTN
jgi:hypothetical protein